MREISELEARVEQASRTTKAAAGSALAVGAMTDTIECPSCGGDGEAFAFVNTGPDSRKHYSGRVKCLRCDGSGQVPAQMPEWHRIGGAFRDARIADGLLMGDVAEALGVSTPTVSKAYHGYIDPAPLIAAWEALSAEGSGESGDAV